MMRRAFLASVAGLLPTRRAQAVRLGVREPGEVAAALAAVGRGAQSGLMRPAVARMAASTVVPWGVASAGSSESARANTCSATSGGSDPAARSAPISTPTNVVNATICCWCGCQGASSDIGSSMGSGEMPMLDAKGAGYQPAPDADRLPSCLLSRSCSGLHARNMEDFPA